MEELQSRAFASGGFGAISATLNSLQVLSVNPMGSVYRRLVMEATCLMSTAFDLGPNLLGNDVFRQLLGLVKIVVSGVSPKRQNNTTLNWRIYHVHAHKIPLLMWLSSPPLICR